MTDWTLEQETPFERSFGKLPKYEQAVLLAALERVLTPQGSDVCSSEWGKALGGGLYEFRVRKSLKAIIEEFARPDGKKPALKPGDDRAVLLRAFFTVHGNRVVLLFSVYDKGRDPSDKRQKKEIARARKLLKNWTRNNEA
ncbi:hypothetical protein [Microbacterium paludicola]|uniref:hypothetical protein n=1 Tax=Microbacterium paludicola TaxID=300019 RepID=UPI0011AB1BC9|nr:hypothetical protein [Microbacterium paludicola]